MQNLLRNGSFSGGKDTPDGWQWVVISGQPAWEFSDAPAASAAGARSIRICQDGRGWHGEFQQRIACAGGKRYRLSGMIQYAIEGEAGQDSANLYVRSYAAGKLVHDMWFRPAFVGRADWTPWTADYVPPAEVDELLVSFAMPHCGGCACFADLSLREVPGPLMASMPLASAAVDVRPLPAPRQVHCIGSQEVDATVRALLEEPTTPPGKPVLELVGDRTTPNGKPAAAAVVGQDEALVIASAEAMREIAPDWKTLMRLADRRTVVVDLACLPLVADKVKVDDFVTCDAQPCAKIEAAHALTQGFGVGDVIQWAACVPGGRFRQRQLRSAPSALERLGLKVIATSVASDAELTGRPVVLHYASSLGGSLTAMDLSLLKADPSDRASANLAAIVLTNALGRPQTGRGRYVFPGAPLFDFGTFRGELEAIAAAHPSITLSEEGQSRLGLPVLSLSIGDPSAPIVYADAGIHSDEWGPCYGMALYMAQLAGLHEKGHPVAKALLKNLQVRAIPLLSPDGWANHVRFIRNLDLNRNFTLFWDDCKDRKGPAPLSEPETQIVDRIFRENRVRAAINWHETSAGTNWVGVRQAGGRYAKYSAAVPAIYRQLTDGRHFAWQAATWTQITDLRNFRYQLEDSFPYVRDYSPQKTAYELFHADTRGIDALTIEQYGNSELDCGRSPHRLDTTIDILEMLHGLQVGLVARNSHWQPRRVEIPLVGLPDTAGHEWKVYDAAGACVASGTIDSSGGVSVVRAIVPPRCWVVVE